MDAPRLEEGPQQKHARRQEPEVEVNSDENPHAIRGLRGATDVRTYKALVEQDLETFEADLLALRQRWVHGEFDFRDFNALMIMRSTFIQLQRDFQDPQVYDTTLIQDIFTTLKWQGAAQAGHREAVKGRWRFIYDIIIPRWEVNYFEGEFLRIFSALSPPGQLPIHYVVRRDIKILIENLPKLSAAMTEIREGTDIVYELQVPPTMIEYRFVAKGLHTTGPLSIDWDFTHADVTDVFLNILLVRTWIGLSIHPIVRISRLLETIQLRGTEKQKKAIKTIKSYVRINKVWMKHLRSEWKKHGYIEKKIGIPFLL